MPDEQQKESGFLINGERYDIPTLGSLTLDEERVLYTYSGTVISDFAPAHPEADEDTQLATEHRQIQLIRSPDFKLALVHIAYRRRNPDLSDTEIRQAIRDVNALEVDQAILEGGEGSPPAGSSQKPHESETDTSEPSSRSGSGSPTERGSARVVEIRERTGTGG